MRESIINQLLSHGITMDGTINGPYAVVVPLSGGKDSQACLMLALREYRPKQILALFCDTNYEHPVTYQHITDTAARAGVDLIKISAGSVLSVCVELKRFPGGGSRHCTSRLKIRPSKWFYGVLANSQGGFEVWYGMRSEESKEREERYRMKASNELYLPHDVLRDYPKYLGAAGVSFRLPILDWAKSEVFELLDGTENPLYAAGFDRIGCFPCLAGGEGHQVKAFNFDDTGRKHFAMAEQIAIAAKRPVLVTKRYADQGPGCAFCCI